MSDDVVCRLVSPDDFREWKVLWDGYNQFYGRSGDTALPADVTQAIWARFQDPGQPVFAIVAECDGKMAGLAHALYHLSTSQIQTVCYLQDLFVAETMRAKGIGRALIADVAVRAAAAGSSRLYWATHETNTKAMVLYDQVAEKSGFLIYRKALI